MPYYHVPHYCGIYYLPTTTINIVQPPVPSWLPQISLSTLSKLQDTASSTTLTQTFVNPSPSTAIAKAKYNFPLYESCAVVSFRCHVGKRLIEGVVKEKEKAKVEFQQAVDRGETAGLLEQQSPDVFSTSIGNIPAGETVKVEIEYIMELKHDAEADGLRFTIPTSIAPRYGTVPHGMSVYPGAKVQGGMKIAVLITMASNIRSVQSPSHPLAVQLGGHADNDDGFSPKHALATLSQPSAELGSDFVLIVKCADLSSPRALLETHATIPNSKALMVTLVPKFNLPPGQKPEIVFVVDRSGSMGPRMAPLQSALGVFLKSLPVGVKFNICSFGSRHSFLWPRSQPYSAETLEQAQRHVDGMRADYGGTVILPPIQATITQRYEDLPLEIMELTDGEVWNPENIFAFVEQATTKGDVRLFSLGIGKDVSHALVEGMARVGKGFAQIVADEREGIEGKVVRMLRGALSPHIDNYRLEWEGKPSEPEPKSSSVSTAVITPKKTINLFDTKVDTDAPIAFSNLPDFVVPSVLQAPYKLPSLFPFSRTTAYVILSPNTPPPTSVWLRGTAPSGDELELEIVVQALQENGQTIHQLAARKILQELEEGTGYLHSGKFGVSKESAPGTFDDWVQREAVRVGVTYGLASKWTSFVAVQKKEAGFTTVPGEDDFEIVEKEDAYSEAIPPQQVRQQQLPTGFGAFSGSSSGSLFGPRVDATPRARAQRSDAAVLSSGSFGSGNLAGGGLFGSAPPAPLKASAFGAGGFGSSTSAYFGGPSPPSSGTYGAQSRTPSGSLFRRSSPVQALFASAPPAPPPPPQASAFGAGGFGSLASQPTGFAHFGSASPSSSSAFGAQSAAPSAVLFETSSPKPALFGSAPSQPQRQNPSQPFGSAAAQAPANPASFAQPLAGRQLTTALIALQSFEGSFDLTRQLAAVMGLQWSYLEAKKAMVLDSLSRASEQNGRLFATLLVIRAFETKLAADKEVWELVVDKAKAWVAGVVGDQDNFYLRGGGLVQEVLAQAQI